MKKLMALGLLSIPVCLIVLAQETKLWTEADRKYLLDNLARSRDELIRETIDLSRAQWNFKESPERWSINEIVEHIATWELLLDHEISRGLGVGPQPQLSKLAHTDSEYLAFIMEEKPHVSDEYTKPFTFTIPMGLNEGKNNLSWFLKMRNESIDFVANAREDLRAYFLKPGRGCTHQIYITLFGHTDRHLRQIRKVKQHPNYPNQ